MIKKAIIMDCDPGHDDAIAIMLALAADNIDLLGITTVGGNQTVEKTTINACKVLEKINRSDILVAKGKSKPLIKKLKVAEDCHGKSGMDGPILPESSMRPVAENAISFMAGLIRRCDRKVCLVPTGPLTNIAAFLLAYPELHNKIECISFMGGGVYEGNRTTYSEFNIWNDPEAAHIVFHSNIPLVMHGLDVTHKAIIYKEEFCLFHEAKDEISKFVGELLDFFSIFYTGPLRRMPGCPMHDSCAVAYLIDPTLFSVKEAYLDLDLKGVYNEGACITDFRKHGDVKYNSVVAMDIDRGRFLKLLKDSCKYLGARVGENRK